MTSLLEPTEALRCGRRALEGLAGYELVDDLRYDERDRCWLLRCRLQVAVPVGAPIPATSEWLIRLSSRYPYGAIGFYPAVVGGLVDTFPHQAPNTPPVAGRPYRGGLLCLTQNRAALRLRSDEAEPFHASRRLRWHCQRALWWLEAAASGRLNQSGDLYDLPVLPEARSPEFVFSASAESLAWLPQRSARVGTLDAWRSQVGPQRDFFRTLYRQDGRPLYTQSWGDMVREGQGALEAGAWLLLPEPPVLPPWRAPQTWGELRLAMERQGLRADELLRLALKPLRRLRSALLVLLFPVPKRHGEGPTRLHAQVILAPRLCVDGGPRDGMTRDRARYARDRQGLLADDRPLLWRTTSNWHAAQITARGSLPSELMDARVLLVGAGALGSVLGELLVRAGLKELLIMDTDPVQIGNLTRHTATLNDIDDPKAEVLAMRLRSLSPHARITARSLLFPPESAEDVGLTRRCDLVIDTTGDDEVIESLAGFPWMTPRTFVSCSLSWGAQRLFAYSATGLRFPGEDFRAQLQRYRGGPTSGVANEDVSGEIIQGCWHPTFPARVDEVWLMASAAIKLIEAAWQQRHQAAPRMVVLERSQDELGACGLRRVLA